MKKVMSPNKNTKSTQKAGTSKQSAETKPEVREDIKAAHDQAEKDIEKDPELSIHSPNDDLDESESVRLGEDKTDLV